MNTAKLVNSALTGGGLIYPENLNVIIGNEDHGYPKGYVLDANAVSSLTGSTTNSNQNINIENFVTKESFNKIFNTGANGLGLVGVQTFEIPFYSNVAALYNFGPSTITSGFNNISSGMSISFGNGNYQYGLNDYVFGTGNAAAYNFQYVNQDKTKIKLIIDQKDIADFLSSKNYAFFANTRIAVKNGNQILRTNNNTNENFSVACNVESVQVVDGKYHIVIKQDNTFKWFDGFDQIFIFNNNLINSTALVFGQFNFALSSKQCSIFGEKNCVSNATNSLISGIGLCNFNPQDGSVVVGRYNYDGYNIPRKNNIFTIGSGNYFNDRRDALIITRDNNSDKLYVNGIGGYNGKNFSDSNTKPLQQVISDIETAVSLNSNGPWDVDITSEFVNGNVTIKPLSMWSISQNVKRVYFTANLKQGDVITIPDTLRMYIGWKISDNRFGMADWNTAGKKYTVTTDSYYVILIATGNDNPGVQTNDLPSFGKVMLRTSNPEFKPTAKTDARKDHTNDDKVMRGIAHQGFHKTERANSLAAFRAAAKEGWRYVETDTYMTTDGKFIVSHDPYLPTGWTNGTVTTTQGSYKYEEHTLAEILAFHGPNNEKTDTLEEFCKTCKECGLHPYIELKQGKMADTNTLDTNPRYNGKGYGVKVLDIVNRYGLRGNATFIASVPFTLLRMAREDQSYRYGIVYFGQLKNSDTAWATVLSKIDEYNNDAVASKAYLFLDANINNLKVADADAVDTLALKNCALEVWTAVTKDDLDNLDPYVTGVTSDNIHAGEILAKKI